MSELTSFIGRVPPESMLQEARLAAEQRTRAGVGMTATSKITGYRQLTEQEVALMNEVKAMAEQCGYLVEKLRGANGISNSNEPVPALDQRWISIGATELQQGFMALVRGIARPTTF